MTHSIVFRRSARTHSEKDNPGSVVSWEELNAAMLDLFSHLK